MYTYSTVDKLLLQNNFINSLLTQKSTLRSVLLSVDDETEIANTIILLQGSFRLTVEVRSPTDLQQHNMSSGQNWVLYS